MDGEGMRKTTVLIVEADPHERDRLGVALERAGFDVVQCSGPIGPEYVCVGELKGSCALLDSADVIVLDLWLESDTVMMGTPSSELLRLYVSAGKPVVTLGAPERANHSFAADPVSHLNRNPEPEELVRVVRAVARSLPRGGTD